MLKKQYRLSSSKDFDLIFRKGNKVRGQFGMLIALYPSADHTSYPPRFGFVVNKKIGDAVRRHQFTRRLRAIVHKLLAELGSAADGIRFSYIAYENPPDFKSLEVEFKSQLDRALRAKSSFRAEGRNDRFNHSKRFNRAR